MRRLILAAVLIGSLISQVSYAEMSIGYEQQGYKKMDESEYNRQKREMNKQKKALLDQKAKEYVPNTQPPLGKPKAINVGQANADRAKGMGGKTAYNKTGKQEGSEGGENVIKRKSDHSTKKSRDETPMIFNTQKKSGCNDRTFGLCPH